MSELLKIDKKRGSGTSVVVADVYGNEQEFGSVRDCATFLEVTVQYVYLALRTGHKVRGCSIRSVG